MGQLHVGHFVVWFLDPHILVIPPPVGAMLHPCAHGSHGNIVNLLKVIPKVHPGHLHGDPELHGIFRLCSTRPHQLNEEVSSKYTELGATQLVKGVPVTHSRMGPTSSLQSQGVSPKAELDWPCLTLAWFRGPWSPSQSAERNHKVAHQGASPHPFLLQGPPNSASTRTLKTALMLNLGPPNQWVTCLLNTCFRLRLWEASTAGHVETGECSNFGGLGPGVLQATANPGSALAVCQSRL